MTADMMDSKVMAGLNTRTLLVFKPGAAHADADGAHGIAGQTVQARHAVIIHSPAHDKPQVP